MRFHSMLILAALAAAPALADDGPVQRLALVVGASRGGPDRVALRYAVTDARAMARVLELLGGVAAPDLVLLEEPDAPLLRGALARMVGDAARAQAAGRRPQLFLYFSGHSDEDGLLLAGRRLPYAELRQALEAIPAQVRVAILDSCASGAFTRSKGGVHRPPFLLDASSQLRGHAFLTSSAADEASQESDRIGASFFTHALLTGLRGAADASGDGVVTLSEAYQFAFQETLARTEVTRTGPQHATYDIGLVGSGDIVLTDLRRAGATLVLPDALAGRVFLRNGAGQLVVELRKLPGTRVELALEAGAYQVRLLRDRRALGGDVQLTSASRTNLEEAGLAPVPLEATASRGGEPPEDPAPPAPPAPRPGLAGRHSIALTLGLVQATGSTSAGTGSAQASGSASAVGGLAYTTWFTDEWAGSLGVGLSYAAGTTPTVGFGASGAVVMPILVGAKRYLPLAGEPTRLFGVLELSAGGYVGTYGRTGVAGASGGTETRLGMRLGAAIDYLAGRYVRLGLGGGYNLVAPFSQPMPNSRDVSGFDAGITIGVLWGGR